MKVKYTKHAERKFRDLSDLGVKVSKDQVEETVGDPVHKDTKTDSPNIIASSDFGKGKILRVVHRNDHGKILIITFYPAKKGRYY